MKSVIQIIPNEPGDFIIRYKDGNMLIEIVTVFGDSEAEFIKSKISKLLNLKTRYEKIASVTNFPKMNIDKLDKQILRILDKKKDKEYFKTFNKSALLLVTSEHNRCGTVPWYLTINDKEVCTEFNRITGSEIVLLNYFRSMVDGGPVIGNLMNEIKLYNKYFIEDL